MREKEAARLIDSYFRFLGSTFPVMCASDEFDFLPRAEAAADYYHKVESFEKSFIHDMVSEIKEYKRRFQTLLSTLVSPEEKRDVALLISNINGTLLEFEINESWKHNPLLYLKIAFIAIDHALDKPVEGDRVRVDRLCSRFQEILRLFKEGQRNLERIPFSFYNAALMMVKDGKNYLSELTHNQIIESDRVLQKNLEEVEKSLIGFERFLQGKVPISDRDAERPILEKRLKDHFGSKRSVKEVYEIALDEWHTALKELQNLQGAINKNRSWQKLYDTYNPLGEGECDIKCLYGSEIENLERFFTNMEFAREMECRPLRLVDTPTYLRSVRSSASFSAPFSNNPTEKAYFYITTSKALASDRVHIATQKRLHREYKFLSSHETYPGHHLLDSFRRSLTTPVRRQVESPLFYEGWAYYAESLLTETGYIKDSIERLVDWKRRLWRSARCQIDVGLATGILNREKAVKLLVDSGFTRQEARIQVNRFGLNPGYQLCYSLGRFEISELKKKYEQKLGWDFFHEVLLKHGELPFHFYEQIFQSICKDNREEYSHSRRVM